MYSGTMISDLSRLVDQVQTRVRWELVQVAEKLHQEACEPMRPELSHAEYMAELNRQSSLHKASLAILKRVAEMQAQQLCQHESPESSYGKGDGGMVCGKPAVGVNAETEEPVCKKHLEG